MLFVQYLYQIFFKEPVSYFRLLRNLSTYLLKKLEILRSIQYWEQFSLYNYSEFTVEPHSSNIGRQLKN